MSKQCQHQCQALKFTDEPKGFCCSGGTINLPAFPPPPPLLMNLLSATSVGGNNSNNDNSAFQMTSFGHRDAGLPGYNPTLRIQVSVLKVVLILYLS